jgi:hypothetical protein
MLKALRLLFLWVILHLYPYLESRAPNDAQEFAWRDRLKPRMSPVRIVGVPAEIRTELVPNRSLGRCRTFNLCGTDK